MYRDFICNREVSALNDQNDLMCTCFSGSSFKNGAHQSSPLDTPGMNPAFTIRRHLLQEKEYHIQIEQMKKVRISSFFLPRQLIRNSLHVVDD